MHRLTAAGAAAAAAAAAVGAENDTATTVEGRKAIATAHIAGAVHRCEAQTAAAAEHLCPEPTAAELDAAHSYLDAASYTRIRSCHAPPTMASFVRHFFDGVTAMLHGGAGGGGGGDGGGGAGNDARFVAAGGGNTPVFRGGRHMRDLPPQPSPPAAAVHASPVAHPLHHHAAHTPHPVPWHPRQTQAWRALVSAHSAHNTTHLRWTTAAMVLGIVMLVTVGVTVLWFCVRHHTSLLRCARPAAVACTSATIAGGMACITCITAPCRAGRGRRFPQPLPAMFEGSTARGGGVDVGSSGVLLDTAADTGGLHVRGKPATRRVAPGAAPAPSAPATAL